MRFVNLGRAWSSFACTLRSGVFILLLCLPATLWAQGYDNPGLGSRPVNSHPADFKPLGVRAGSFMLHPGVELAAEFHDNILYTSKFELSDTIFHLRPYLTAQSNWSRHSINIRLAADVARYSDYDIRDYEDYFFQVSGLVDVMSRSGFNYGFDYMQLHEERNNRSAQQGVNPTVYKLTGGNLGYDHTFNRMSLGILASLRQLDFDNAKRLNGDIIDNQDRDRDEKSLQLRAGYQFQPDKQVFISYIFHDVDYDQEFDRNGQNRDSSGYSINAGVDFSITGVLTGDVFVTYHDRSYDDPQLNDVSGWAGGMGLTWLPTTLTTVNASIISGVEQTTLASSSGYLRTLYSLRVDHELLRNLQLIAMVSYTDNNYQQNDGAPDFARDYDKYWSAAVGATYFINRSFYFSASYDYNDFSTNIPFDDFTANRFWLVLGMER